MRTKPLNNNYNSMSLIMENFRRYSDEEDVDRVYLLEEGKVHKETSLSTLIEMRDSGEIDTLQLVDLINESAEYEVDQLLSEQEEVGNKPKGFKAKVKYAFREKMLTFMYSKVAAYLKATFGQDEKAIGGIQNQLSQASAALKSGNTKKAMKLLSGAAFKSALKPIALLFKVLGKIVKGILWIVGKIGSIFKHPIVRVILIGALCVIAFQAITTGAAVAAGVKVINQVTALATGKTAIAHGMKVAGKAGVAAVKGALTEEQQLNESEDMIELASILGDLNFDTLGAAIISAAARLEDAEVYSETDMFSIAYMGPDGEVIESTTAAFRTADAALNAEMSSIGIMKLALSHIQRGGDLEELGGVPAATGEAMQAAVQAARMHCESDPAACVGVEKLSSTIQEIWSGTVESEHLSRVTQLSDEVVSSVESIATSSTQTAGVSSVTGGAEAAAQIGMGNT